MTPLKIEMLLWYYSRVEDYREGDFSAPAVREAIDSFLADGLLMLSDAVPRTRSYCLTDRGEAYVKHLMAIPLPVAVWVVRQ